MEGLAFPGGAMINCVRLRARVLRGGGAAVIAWPCLLLAAQGLGVYSAVIWACAGFLPFLLLRRVTCIPTLCSSPAVPELSGPGAQGQTIWSVGASRGDLPVLLMATAASVAPMGPLMLSEPGPVVESPCSEAITR